LLIGNSSGQSGRRHYGNRAALNVVLALLLDVLLDFDHPSKGMILPDLQPLWGLRAARRREVRAENGTLGVRDGTDEVYP
jgi:hypothetical protein